MRINGLKSHDYHIWIKRLLPVMVRGYLPNHVWQVLAELSCFFCILCAKELSRPLVKKLEDAAPVLLCKLEKISIHLVFSIQCSTLFCTSHVRHEWRGIYMPVGAIQLKGY
jgi:hypothetical protein